MLCLALAIAVAARHRIHRTHRAFFLLTASLAGWNGAYFAYLWTTRPTALRFLLLISFSIPPAVIHFLRRFFYEEMPALRDVRRVSIWSSLVLGLATLSLPLNDPVPIFGTPTKNVLIGLSTIYLIATFAYSTYLLQQRRAQVHQAVEETRLRYLRNGGFVVLACLVVDAAFSAPWGFGFQQPRVAAIALTAYAYFIYLSILDYRLLEMQEILGRATVISVAGSLLALFYVALAAFAGRSFGVVFLYAFMASLVVLLLYEPVRRYLISRLERFFFHKTYQIKEIAEILSEEMLKTRRPEELIGLMLREFSRLERVTDVCAYLWNPRLGKYAFAGARGTAVARLPSVVAPEPLIHALERSRRWMLRADLEDQLDGEGLTEARRSETRGLLDQMAELRAELVVPLLTSDRCIGLFGFQDERAIEAYADNECNAFAQVAATAAVLLENFRAVEELGDRERLASLGEMAAGLAHEIRNPLGSIKGAVQYLQDELDPAPKSKEFFDIIVAETDRLSKVVADFLDYSRNPVLRKRSVDLGELANQTIRQLELEPTGPAVTIRAELGAALPPALADPDRIKQVLLNLLQNAVAMMPGGGEIVVSTGTDEDGSVPYAWIAVRDTGPGMDEATMERIFTPFFTTRESGVGLGLAISHRIVESHGGRIEVRSAPGEGSTFTVKLPVARPQGPGDAQAAPPARRASGVR